MSPVLTAARAQVSPTGTVPELEPDSAETPVSTRGFVFLVRIAALVPCVLSSLGEVDHGVAGTGGDGAENGTDVEGRDNFPHHSAFAGVRARSRLHR